MTTKSKSSLSRTDKQKIDRALQHLGTQRNNSNVETSIRRDRYEIKVKNDLSIYIEIDEDEDIEVLIFARNEAFPTPEDPPEKLETNSEPFGNVIGYLNESLRETDSINKDSINPSRYQDLPALTTYTDYV